MTPSSSMAPYPSGKGEVCKTFMHRFESDRRFLNQMKALVALVTFIAFCGGTICATACPAHIVIHKQMPLPCHSEETQDHGPTKNSGEDSCLQTDHVLSQKSFADGF